MFREKVTVVIFEGGNPTASVEKQMLSVRKGIALDNMYKALTIPDIDEVILATNYPDLAEAAERAGAVVDRTSSEGFHFGEHLKYVVDEYDLQNVIYLGGAALPLIRVSDFARIAGQLRELKNVVIVNNAQSADLIAFTPTEILEHIDLPRNDNFLGYLLREAGLRRILIENSARINFDLDTPVDMLVLDKCSNLGERTREALDGLDLPMEHLTEAMRVIEDSGPEYAEVALIGRVGPSMMAVINANLPVRLRVFSEERGMKALKREKKGEAVSLLGYFLEQVGAREFFRYLSLIADVAFIDTRVLFAHMNLSPSASDRFHSDLGELDEIDDEYITEFTRAAYSASIPVVLGGHSLVYGGLWSLLEELGLLKHGLPSLPTS